MSLEPSATDLVGVGALNAPTTVYYGNGNVDLNAIVGVGAISNTNIVATGGADVTIGSGLLNVSALTSQNLLVDGDSSITLDAAGISVGSVLTDLLNKTTVAFSGSGGGTFTFTPPTVGLLSSFTIDVDEIGPGDKIVIPYSGDGVLSSDVLREPQNLITGAYTGYNSTTGYLTLTNGTLGLNQVNVRIKMTPEEYTLFSANRGTYLDGANDVFTFPGTVDPNEPPYAVPCFARGTLIETQHGQVAIENLAVGDMVQTRDHGFQPIRWIGSKKVSASILVVNPQLQPIRIKAGALGANTPSQDLMVSPEHRILVRSKIALRLFGAMEVLVAAKQLLQLDGVDIANDVTEVEYFHMLFENHEIVVSNGAETESLYTGPIALQSVGNAAAEEIFMLLPELRDDNYISEPARQLVSGRAGRKLAVRHLQQGRALVM